MPITAERIIASHAQVENSGRSVGFPRRIAPYRLKASARRNTRHTSGTIR
jgi:hypothetical protein